MAGSEIRHEGGVLAQVGANAIVLSSFNVWFLFVVIHLVQRMQHGGLKYAAARDRMTPFSTRADMFIACSCGSLSHCICGCCKWQSLVQLILCLFTIIFGCLVRSSDMK